MRKPLYLQMLAFIFGDPLLENTGLEGGALESALDLMSNYIEKLLLSKFPAEKSFLEDINNKIRSCINYLKLISQDRQQHTVHALTKISEDIRQLTTKDWLIIPGGWNSYNKPGHAMLYLVFHQRLVIINTGNGIQYHEKFPQCHEVQIRFLTITYLEQRNLLQKVLPGLLQFLIKPADYYSAELLYEVLFRLLEGKVMPELTYSKPFSHQLAGTCFWQCVDKLLFYFYQQKPEIFHQFQQMWEQSLLENVFHELQNGINGTDVLDETVWRQAPWETYFRLIIFATRAYSIKQLQFSSVYQTPAERQRVYFLLEKLTHFAEQQLKRPRAAMNNTYQPLPGELWHIDSSFTLFDSWAQLQPAIYNPLPQQMYSQANFIPIIEGIVGYISVLNWENEGQLINAHFLLEQFFHHLPQPTSKVWKVFLQRTFTLSELEMIVKQLRILVENYYRLQVSLYPKPLPDHYVKQIIAGFSVFCLIDHVLKNEPALDFLKNYTISLTHLINQRSLLCIAPELIATSPQLAKQLRRILVYIRNNNRLIETFNYAHKSFSCWSCVTKHDSPTVRLLQDCLQRFQRQTLFEEKYKQQDSEQRLALGILDMHHEFLPNLIHWWRESALYCRLLLTGFTASDRLLPPEFWSISAEKCLLIKFNGYNDYYKTPAWGNYGTILIQDTALKWLCDTPAIGFQENNILVQQMPEPTWLNRHFFNQLAAARVSANLQILSILELLSQQAHQLQFPELRALLEKYLFTVGENVEENGSLLLQECEGHQFAQLKSLLLHFMNMTEYYFAGQLNRIESYLTLIGYFLHIESFLLSSAPQLICHNIYDKLHLFLQSQEKYHCEIAAHLILLYENYYMLASSPTVDVQVTERILIGWSYLLRAKNLQREFPTALYQHAKRVLLYLQDRIIKVLANPEFCSKILTIFLKTLLQLTTSSNLQWQVIMPGCYQGNEYFVNLFDGMIYCKGFPLTGLPDEITNHPDYLAVNGKKIIAIELERAKHSMQVYRSLMEPAQFITLYQCNSDSEKEIVPPKDEKLLAFHSRQYGTATYPRLNYCRNVHATYFSPEHFNLMITSAHLRSALLKQQTKLRHEIIIHQELTMGERRYWAQYLPHWRLEGLLPAALMKNHTFWLACTLPPNAEFMALDKETTIALNNTTDKQTIFLLDAQQQCHYVCYLLPGNKIYLFKLDDYGQTQQQWIDILRLEPQSSLIPYCNTFCQFELPTYILGWQQRDGAIMIELTRHQLSFRWHAQSKTMHAIQFDGYELLTTPLPTLGNFNYQLVLKNVYDEMIIILPYLEFTLECFLEKNPLYGQIQSNLLTLYSPSYFVYSYLTELQQLEADTQLAQQYLALLYTITREYATAFNHIQVCWTDQLLSAPEWQLFMRYFTETASDVHPDVHACRLHYFLLLLPTFYLMEERKCVNDPLTSLEEEQFRHYKALSSSLANDYKNYLNKWLYIAATLRLNNEQECMMLAALERFSTKGLKSFPVELQNRQLVLSKPYEALSTTHNSASFTADFQSILKSNAYFSSGEFLKERFISLGTICTDSFGYAREKPILPSSCFVKLYNDYFTKQITPMQLEVILYTIAWNTLLSSTLSKQRELALLHLLYRVKAVPLHELIPLPCTLDDNKLFTLSYAVDVKLNLSVEETQVVAWFRQLFQSLINRQFHLPEIKFTDTDANLQNQQVKYTLSHATSNTLPTNSKVPISQSKFTLSLNKKQFQQEYGFDPEQPLGAFFTCFFSHEQQKIKPALIPLTTGHNDDSDYAKLLRENTLAGHLLEYFQRDYASYQNTSQSCFAAQVSNPVNSLQYQLTLTHLQTKLQRAAEGLRIALVALANKNPCKSENPITGADDQQQMGLQLRYATLGRQRDSMDLTELFTLFLTYNQKQYSAYNPFLTTDNILHLANQTVVYLLIASALKQLKRLLSLCASIDATTDARERQNLIAQISKESFQRRHYSINEKPAYLLFEYLSGYLLWEQQIKILEQLKAPFKSQVEQLIMGGGKSSVLAPLLGYLLADGKHLMLYTVPSSLINIFFQLLRNRFRGVFTKRVHTLNLQRSTLLTTNSLTAYLQKLQLTASNRDVLVVTPDVPNCLLLKWLELTHSVFQGKRECQNSLAVLEDILSLLESNGVQLIDELDLILAPLKSELNFTEGAAQTLQPAPMRWELAQQLLLRVLIHPQLQPLINQAIVQYDFKSHGKHMAFPHGMLELVNLDFYHQQLKFALANLVLQEYFIGNEFVKQYHSIFLAYLLNDPGIKTPQGVLLNSLLINAIAESKVLTISMKEQYQNLHQLLQFNGQISYSEGSAYYCIENNKLYMTSIHPLLGVLITIHIQHLRHQDQTLAEKLILTKEWLNAILPHVLQKRLFIHYGPYFELDINGSKNINKIYYSNKKLATPYTGKDSPSRRSEFQHPDIVIAFTCLQYFYSGLRLEELIELCQCLQQDMEGEIAAALHERKAVVLFQQWQQDAKFTPIALHQLDLTDNKQMSVLHAGLSQQLPVVQYYLNRLVFPCYLKTFSKKNTSNGFDLAGMLFAVSKGFSGTMHNYLCLPDNLSLNFQIGADGSLLHILTLMANQKVLLIDYENDKELLNKVDLEEFRMLIDAGGLIQQMSNFEVAHFLLMRAPENICGIIFVEDSLQQLRVLTRNRQIQTVKECGFQAQYLFKYVDHAHTTGTDMPQYLNDRGLITVSPNSTLREIFGSPGIAGKLANFYAYIA
jgi:hypothetical protein